jgi:hypothetical protein
VNYPVEQERRWGLPNENAHQLRALIPAPAQAYASSAALTEGAARAALRARPARRLHVGVRRPGVTLMDHTWRTPAA